MTLPIFFSSDVYYGSEGLTPDQPQAYTCPFCGRMGFTELTMQEHITADHPHSSTEVVCPICASLPGGEPNHVTDDFAGHLALEHRAPRDFISFPICLFLEACKEFGMVRIKIYLQRK
jgi:hypothetical protein